MKKKGMAGAIDDFRLTIDYCISPQKRTEVRGQMELKFKLGIADI